MRKKELKKIIFVINSLDTGGVQTSLLNLLNEIHNTYDITVLCFYCTEEHRSLLPSDVKILTVKYPFRHLGMTSNDVKGTPRYFGRAFWAMAVRLFGRSNVIKIMSLFQKKIGEYDYAISFLHEARQKSFYGGCNEFVLNKVIAKNKFAWLHCDFSLSGANNRKSKYIYQKFDKIIACSDGARAAFVSCLPEFAQKTVSIRNCNNYNKISKMSSSPVLYDKNYFNILTVARLSEEKGIDRVMVATKCMIDKGYRVRYHIVGSGDQEHYLREKAKELCIDDNVVFYGNQSNPYSYMVNADLLVLASYHEAAPMVFDEAAYLNLPVLATKTTSTKEMIEEVGGGWVCENNQKAIEDTLLKVVSDKKLLQDVKKQLENRRFSNDDIVRKFRNILLNNINNK